MIASKLDPQLVEASQSLRALEEGNEADYYPIEQEVVEEERPAKRARADGAGPEGKEVAGGILGGDALENIKFYAEKARQQAEEERNRKVPPKKASGMALLGGYGSGDESD